MSGTVLATGFAADALWRRPVIRRLPSARMRNLEKAMTDGFEHFVRPAWRGLHRLFESFTDPDRFLRRVRGVIHVGANSGPERHAYARLGLNVLWIEPIPEVFATLERNIRAYPRQRAVMALVTDVDGREYDFHVSSNDGLSSSIFDLARHRELWPEVDYAATMKIPGTTLPTLLAREGIDAAGYQALILDTQGSELLVLRGAEPVLRGFEYVKTEAADFESYAGCCLLDEMTAFMASHGFQSISRHRFAGRAGVGSYYDIVYRRCG